MRGSYSVSLQIEGDTNADTSLVYVITFICVCTCAYIHLWYFSYFTPPPLPPILLSTNCHSDYDTIDGRIAGIRRPYLDNFQRSIKSPRVQELCQTHFVVLLDRKPYLDRQQVYAVPARRGFGITPSPPPPDLVASEARSVVISLWLL